MAQTNKPIAQISQLKAQKVQSWVQINTQEKKSALRRDIVVQIGKGEGEKIVQVYWRDEGESPLIYSMVPSGF